MSRWAIYSAQASEATVAGQESVFDPPARAFIVLSDGDLTIRLPDDDADAPALTVTASIMVIPVAVSAVRASSTATILALW